MNVMYRIKAKEYLSTIIAKFEIEAPYIARKRKPGNFVIIRVIETGERIPLTLVESNEKSGTITLIVQAIGKTTKLLLTKKPGDAIVDIVGPLGHSTPIQHFGAVVCVGGGVGTA
ncbi:MAG TPA: FAD-binding oxidoreductase, partial [Bacteroidota bacterium]|nr:FAD-binding oxidoreductase [Bacteroidota bacterium]